MDSDSDTGMEVEECHDSPPKKKKKVTEEKQCFVCKKDSTTRDNYKTSF